MERPDDNTVAAYLSALPDDVRVQRGQMFAHPCAFVNGNMFFGTFAQTLIARVGVERTAALRAEGVPAFEPMPGRPWKDYVQLPASLGPAALAAFAREALELTAAMPPKVKKPKAAPGKKGKA